MGQSNISFIIIIFFCGLPAQQKKQTNKQKTNKFMLQFEKKCNLKWTDEWKSLSIEQGARDFSKVILRTSKNNDER